jgi:hypothetical protein
VASNVFAGNDLILTKPPNGISGTDDPYAGCGSTVSGKLSGSTAKIAGKGYGNQLDVVAVGRNLYLSGPQIQVGQLSSPAGDPPVDSLWLQNKCSSQATSALHWCVNGGADQMYVTNFYASSSSSTATIPSTLVKVPSLTCCAPYANPLGLGPAAASPPSTMAWLYRNADLGPHAPCQVSSGTPPIFDTASGTPDDSINMSATPAGGPPINLTPGSSYTCRSLRNGSTRGELSWNATSHVLTVTGTVFIDGSAKIDPGPSVKATSAGYGAIVLTGTFQMINATMCVKLSGSSCDQNAWFPDTQALIITADGDFGTDSTTQGTSTLAGIGIDLQSSDFQGALIANKSVYVETNTGMQGPLVSVYGSVLAGQSGTLTFPPLRFPPSAGGELVNEPPLPKLLPPQQFNGG